MSNGYFYRRDKKEIGWWLSRTYGQIRKRSLKLQNCYPPYSLKEFSDWIMCNKYRRYRLNRLFKKWIASKFLTDFVPSIDRIDDYKGYDFSNIQLTIWRINNSRGRKSPKAIAYRKTVKEKVTKLQGVPVFKIHSDGRKDYFPSLAEAGRSVNRSYSLIWRACKTGIKCGGYKWIRSS